MLLHCRYFPPRRFYAINLFGCIIVRHGTVMTPDERRHEDIHTCQMREMLYVFFYLWYGVAWLYHFLRLRHPMRAYFAIAFEREAYRYMHQADYLKRRRHFQWWRMMVGKA